MTDVTFSDLGLGSKTLDALSKKGFVHPTEIQKKTIPLLLKGKRDIVGQAQTGTGKTACFALPILEKIENNPYQAKTKLEALILVPTRELATQVATEIESLRGDRDISVLAVYGGTSMSTQLRELKRGVHIVVGTPGRILDHLDRGTLSLDHISYLVLDEADEMLSRGFFEDIEDILGQAPPQRRMLLFSATMPKMILDMAKRFMGEFDLIKVEAKSMATQLTKQVFYEIREDHKLEALCRLIDVEDNFYGIVFCQMKIDVDRLTELLLERGHSVAALHGDVSQNERERILAQFKAKEKKVLVATDVAARGIDVADLSHVVNFALPQNPEIYVHRIGRTGRAGREGLAISLITPRDFGKLSFIRKITNANIEKAKLPGVEKIIATKQKTFRKQLGELLDETYDRKAPTALAELITELTAAYPAEKVIAVLIEAFSGRQLDPSSYPKIEEYFDRQASGGHGRRGPQSSSGGRGGDRRYSERRPSGGGGGYRRDRSDRGEGGGDNRGRGRRSPRR